MFNRYISILFIYNSYITIYHRYFELPKGHPVLTIMQQNHLSTDVMTDHLGMAQNWGKT